MQAVSQIDNTTAVVKHAQRLTMFIKRSIDMSAVKHRYAACFSKWTIAY